VASQADRSGTVESASLTAAVAYLRASRAQALALARAGDLGLAQELVDLAGAQVAAGVAPQLDETRANTRLAEARGALIDAESQRDRAQIVLARALGLDPSTRFALTDTLSAALGASGAPEDEAAAIAMALQQRPELAAESARRAKTRDEKSSIAAERLPRLDLAADYGVNGEHANDAIGTGEVSLAVTLPLLDGWRRESRIDEHNASIRESEVREKDLRDQAAAEVSASLLELRSGVGQLSVADERLALAERELVEARDRFESGIAGNLDVINAQTGLVAARDAVIDARFAIALARATLARAAGSAHTLH
jgi:outer membrane protein TolC